MNTNRRLYRLYTILAAAAILIAVCTVPLLAQSNISGGTKAQIDFRWVLGSTLSSKNPVFAQIVTSTGALVDTFGGGQQYANGVAKGTETGTLSMWSDGTNIRAASYAYPLPIVPYISGAAAVADAADQAVRTNNPAPIGGKLDTDATKTSMPSYDLNGNGFTRAIPVGATRAAGVTAAITDTTSTSVIAGVGSQYMYLSECSAVNSHATVGTLVNFQDAVSGTTLFTLAAGAVFGGHQKNFSVPFKVPTVAHAIACAPVTTGANVICSCSGFTSPTSY